MAGLKPHGLPGALYGDFSGKELSDEPILPSPFVPIRSGMGLVLERPLLPQSVPQNLRGLQDWSGVLVKQLSAIFGEYGFRLNRTLPKGGTEPMTAPLPLAHFTVATLPDATAWEGAVIYVSDGASGARIRASNGTAWVNLG